MMKYIKQLDRYETVGHLIVIAAIIFYTIAVSYVTPQTIVVQSSSDEEAKKNQETLDNLEE